LFSNPEFGEIRTLETDTGKIMFCGKDVAAALGYTNARKALADHCKGVTKCDTLTNGGRQELSFIPESDVYRLAFGSKLPNAERFTDWVTEKVLPQIMRTGSYSVTPQDEKALDIQLINARTANANVYLTLMQHIDTKSESYKGILMAYAANTAAGQLVLPLPKAEFGKTYSASDIGRILGISRNKVGRIANEHGLKSDGFGEWYHDVAANGKECDNFRYNDAAIEKFREILGA
jgi:prophage antirepressor-like protein